MLRQLLFVACILIPLVFADVYLHNPPGSNNRNCEYTARGSTNNAVGNQNRLFRSENNAEGGYNCPLGRDPFSSPDKAYVVDTPKMFYYVGSKLKLEWTMQHSCGGNTHCQIVLQYMCDDSAPGLRDGKPNPDSTDNQENQGIARITAATKDNLFYGQHEPYEVYQKCATRQRNKGLFAGVQAINGDTARFTRQNQNGNDYGFECQEERDYYPYWHPSPWRDIAIFTTNTSMCDWYKAESQNVKARGECYAADGKTPQAQNTERECVANQGVWKTQGAFNANPPECLDASLISTWDNQLGNSITGDLPTYWWTIPETPSKSCVFRIRYNITTGDFHPFTTDSTMNGKNSPVQNTANSNGNWYKDFGYGWELGLKMNANQYGRVFEDRTHTFEIRARKDDKVDETINIYNLNIKGKRGNLVNIYPAVEYDFVPTVLQVKGGDYLHIQWTGSDFNQDRQPNAAEGGPNVPTTSPNANYAADRHNMVQVSDQTGNIPRRPEQVSLFRGDDGKPLLDLIKKLALPNQPINDPSPTVMCKNYTEIYTSLGNDAGKANLHHQNCAKLAGAKHPYFNAGLVKMVSSGKFAIVSTRNNNFSNRSHKGTIIVDGGWFAAGSKAVPSIFAIALIALLCVFVF